MRNISNLFYFGTTLYMFRTVFPSFIRSLRRYIQHQVYKYIIQVLWLLASKQPHLVGFTTEIFYLLFTYVFSTQVSHPYVTTGLIGFYRCEY